MCKKTCKNCKYWARDDISDGLLPQDEQGTCSGLMGGVYYLELKTDLIDDLNFDECEEFYSDLRITTEHDFYCKNYRNQKEI